MRFYFVSMRHRDHCICIYFIQLLFFTEINTGMNTQKTDYDFDSVNFARSVMYHFLIAQCLHTVLIREFLDSKYL